MWQIFADECFCRYKHIVTSYHVFDSRLEVAQEGFGLISLDFTVLDGFSSQVVVHLYSKDGCRTALILGADITCARGTTDMFHSNLYSVSVDILYLPIQRATLRVWWILSVMTESGDWYAGAAGGQIPADTLIHATLFYFWSHTVVGRHVGGLHQILLVSINAVSMINQMD